MATDRRPPATSAQRCRDRARRASGQRPRRSSCTDGRALAAPTPPSACWRRLCSSSATTASRSPRASASAACHRNRRQGDPRNVVVGVEPVDDPLRVLVSDEPDHERPPRVRSRVALPLGDRSHVRQGIGDEVQDDPGRGREPLGDAAHHQLPSPHGRQPHGPEVHPVVEAGGHVDDELPMHIERHPRLHGHVTRTSNLALSRASEPRARPGAPFRGPRRHLTTCGRLAIGGADVGVHRRSGGGVWGRPGQSRRDPRGGGRHVRHGPPGGRGRTRRRSRSPTR